MADADFQPIPGHQFNFRAPPMPQWDGIVDCQVLVVEPHQQLSCSWNTRQRGGRGVNTIVTWTLTPTEGGTHVRMEQSGFRLGDKGNYQCAGYGWQKFIGGLARVVARLD